MTHARANEKGIALVFTLFLMASLSALAVSLMFLSQTETASTRNYRTMSQARYAGEAGVHKAINYLLSTGYVVPSQSQITANYDTTVSPVTCVLGCTTTGPVVLSGLTGVSSNYPDSTVASAFSTATQGSLCVKPTTCGTGDPTVTYGATATLMSMRFVNVYGGGSGVIQTWQITADGVVPGTMPATVEVTAMLERQYVDAQTFAVFATGTGCGAINMNGNSSTGSYDSSVGSATTTSGGNMGTNGNMTIAGSVAVHGALSSPRTGVGSCVNGSGVTALTESGSAVVDNNAVVQLPQPIVFPTPALPATLPPTVAQTTCLQMAVLPPATCSTVSGVITIDPMNSASPVRLGDISGNIVLKAGNYSINSIGSGNLSVAPSLLGAAGPVNTVINLVGRTSTGTQLANPFNLGGNAVVNSSMDAAKLQIMYAGTGMIDMTGGAQASFMLYAPNASATTHGNTDIFGSILVANLATSGNTRFYYDRNLNNKFFTMGNYLMSSFSWKKY